MNNSDCITLKSPVNFVLSILMSESLYVKYSAIIGKQNENLLL